MINGYLELPTRCPGPASRAADEPSITHCVQSLADWHCIPLSICGHCGMGVRLGWAMVVIRLAIMLQNMGDRMEQIKAGMIIEQLEESKTPSREHQASPGCSDEMGAARSGC